jgi:hypothetical protein
MVLYYTCHYAQRQMQVCIAVFTCHYAQRQMQVCIAVVLFFGFFICFVSLIVDHLNSLATHTRGHVLRSLANAGTLCMLQRFFVFSLYVCA